MNRFTTMRILRNIVLLLTVLTNIGCDQISKDMVRKHISYYEHISVVRHHFTLTNVENTGAFLSLGNEWPSPVREILLVVLPIIALIAGLAVILFKQGLSALFRLGASCVIGGGIGNIIDRAVRGSVTDFLHLKFGIFQTGIFNLADVSIMVGTFLVMYSFYKDRNPSPKLPA
ncbi:signal peptidase II [Runella sp.]|uniref:signal peptidase II n=1 Tax=Runella sp. TaxID=1960881 RepID=UPI003D12A187